MSNKAFSFAPEPPSELGRYRILSSTAGVRVSPLQLGGMSIGEAWQDFMGSMNKDDSFKLLDTFYDLGGNFIDLANTYQNEESERWVGEWMKARSTEEHDRRDHIVLASKYTTPYTSYRAGQLHAVNHSGNHKKSLHISLRDSLKKLHTDYIDVFYVHWWDWTTSIEELMDSLDIIVKSGKVLYLGISDTPAYIVAAANTYAKDNNKTQFSIYQGRYNIMLRDMEREIIPMCRHFGMAIAPWDAMGGGKFQSKKQIEDRRRRNESLRSLRGNGDQTEDEVKISATLEEVGEEHGGVSPQAVALAYVMAKTPGVFPIVGGRKVEHLKSNVKSLSIRLSDEQIQKLESVVPFQSGFPNSLIGEDPHIAGRASFIIGRTAPLAFVRSQKPIGYE